MTFSDAGKEEAIFLFISSQHIPLNWFLRFHHFCKGKKTPLAMSIYPQSWKFEPCATFATFR